ncbi:hypothetical protein SH611_11590 [Geminicoccaceae bacterium 1502E]|nr:hypothetical protein [Geminicoccaceae bacterium 1502E]
MLQKIPSPDGHLSEKPDAATREGLKAAADYTGAEASQRVLYVNLGILRYGTNDKTHAAAVVTSMSLLIMLAVVAVTGFYASDTGWRDEIFGWLTTVYLIVTGVAVGRGGQEKNES